ncbi:MAG: GNAT family acetyltransferase [Thiothrix sp.]|nr:GNAT family acetyltransferase [Thiothrix sp.]HPE61788.1 GNAT family acetyltransferase [Thiolinea sp.]
MEIRPYQHEDEATVIRLWTNCGLAVPWNNPQRDIERKLMIQPELFLVATENAVLLATVMAGYEGHRGWINYLAVHPQHRRRGLGRRMMQAAETRLRALGCPKINLQVRSNNTSVIRFYEAIGFEDDACVSLGKRLIPDHPDSR